MNEAESESGGNLLEEARSVHLVGIGGIGMSALADLLLARGISVSGSDVRTSNLVEALRSRGARIAIGHSAGNVGSPDLVVSTSAARSDNPEIAQARRSGIPVVKRAELLGWLMDDSYGLAVAGTHGKTTTTGMLAFILHRAGLDPTAMIGGEPLDFPSNGLVGKSRYLVAEADEYDRSFLRLWPRVAIVTSVEADHLDCYADLSDILVTFERFASRIPEDGLLVTSADDPNLRSMNLAVPRQRYGFDASADWRITSCVPVAPYGTYFTFYPPAGSTITCNLLLSGRHYALDALAAIVAAQHVGVPAEQSARAIAAFRGTKRRFELVGEARGVVIIDDYGHHPTEVRATLSAARERHPGPLWCVFQPHTVNRTEKLFAEFASAFEDADHLLVLPIYHPAGREQEVESVSSRTLVAAMRHPDAREVGSLDEATSLLQREVTPDSMVITMGAGDVNRVGQDLLARLEAGTGGMRPGL